MIYGRQDPAEQDMPKCPCCHAETNDLYESEEGEIVGCPECVEDTEELKMFDAWMWWREIQETEYENYREMMRDEV